MPSDQDSIFNSNENNTSESETKGETSNNSNQEFKLPDGVADLVGEGKKYSSVEEALKSVPHAQTHIERLEQELSELRGQVDKVHNIEEILARLDSKSGETGQENDNVAEDTTSSDRLDEAALEQLIEATLTKKEQQRTAQQNITVADEQMKATFGEKAKEVLVSRSEDLGISVQDMMATAAKSPKAFLSLMGVDGKPSSSDRGPSHIKSSVNTEAFQQKPAQQSDNAKVPVGASTQDMVAAWKASKPNVN